MTSTLSLPEERFAQLAAGFGDAETVRWLVRAQGSVQRELLSAVGTFGPRDDARFTAAWGVLLGLDASAPEAVTQVLAHPYTRVWASTLLGNISRGEFIAADVHHMEAVAASAAILAGIDLRLPVPVRDGKAPLPLFGALRAAETVWIDTCRVTLDEPVRTLTHGDLTVTLEDTDPYRALPYIGSEIEPTGRLTAAEARQWQRAFTGALEFIETHLPAYLPGLRVGLRTILPLRPDGPTDRSASARTAFGAVGIAARQLNPQSLAELLVHEFQHVKLGAMMDAFELYDRADIEPRYHPPCFSHPRPIEGLLHSTYAHLALTDFWQAQRTIATGSAAAAAADRHAEVRALTAEGIALLESAGSLTVLGTTVLDAMRHRATD
ncbi:HEXXH motif-containing putative peptide modification protein [Nocardia sp. NBC_01503]|uniref:aKG-HExxH-type peptide beta-hydroxylase n=1 Tax=Nocardia sp. NBC_01503 TaxID=2975997 RepID=UPI002E7B4C02|nr:HEXXH motif-containing putative peptide modification protein [Nocardia sp. NBC_01503]WTL29947.1 HEXXH motif-containing putative peptide modification protein [Nocardia sp. NBC_01503]